MEKLGPIPIGGDLPKANKLLSKWDSLRQRLKHDTVFKDLWETFVWTSPYSGTSREFFALPTTWKETGQALEMGLVDLRKLQSTRSLEWLEEHGTCGDNLREGLSEIPQAARGAFATRFMKKDSIVAPLPLVHVPHRKRLEMFRPDVRVGKVVNRSKADGQQLLINYCFGHRDSTMLLCPYGLLTGLINHARNPNVKIRWSDPKRSGHSPEWMNKTVADFAELSYAVLSMELVALRDIEPDEEVVLDYGEEWETAWNAHVTSWTPVEGAASYISALDLNEDDESVLKTEFQQFTDPYPNNVHIRFDVTFAKEDNWAEFHHLPTRDTDLVRCDVLSMHQGDDGEISYTTVYLDDDDEEYTKVEGVPRDAFVFRDNAYTGDFFQHNVFRHDIRIRDEIFPESWKNLLTR